MAAIDINQEVFTKEVEQGTGMVLVDFWAPWCIHCRRIAPALDQVAQKYEGRVPVLKVNIDEEPELARKYEIKRIPTLTVFRAGEALGSIEEPDSKAKIEALIEEHL